MKCFLRAMPNKEFSMKVKVLSRKGENLVFTVEGITPAMANALRRIMISEIPTLAIEWVDFHENTSPLFDEIIAHRLGLIPLSFAPERFNLKEKCKCEGKGCPLCEVVFVIDKTGPGTVYSGDMKSSNREIKPLSPAFPVTELQKGERLRLEAVAVSGTGKQHAKWQAAIASYQYYPDIIVRSDDCDLRKCVRNCPKGILEVKGKKLVIKDPLQCDMCRACLEGCDCVEFSEDASRFVFRVESVSGLKPDYIINKAAEILQDKAKEFKGLVDKL